jgi:zinc transporter ZupT
MTETENRFTTRTWMFLILPVVLLLALVVLFLNTNPIRIAGGDLPPVEEINIQRITLPDHGRIVLQVVNGGPDPVTIAQVLVDDAYWQFKVEPENTLDPLQSGQVVIYYPWVEGEAHEIVLISNTGATFDAAVELAVQTPSRGLDQLLSYALVGVYVGIIPVGLGMLWFPAMRQFSRRLMNFVLALTIGLMLFLVVDTFLEMVEVAERLPGVFQGTALGIFAALLTWLAITAVGNRDKYADRATPSGRAFIAFVIALGIGFHNLGEGLAVGAAFALGEAALGSFLVVGFILHNLTEGIGIVAPVLRDQPKYGWFALMLLLAGGPAIIGTLIGGFAYSPVLTVIFLGVGVGAIWQVIIEVGRLVMDSAKRREENPVTWLNVLGLLLGIVVMYLTAFLVNV